MHAASALGRLGLTEDVVRLEQTLQDREWWVRYRAAQALACMPFISMDDLRRMSIRSPDPYARDILQQVISEQPAYGL